MAQQKKTRQEILRIIDQIQFLDRSFRFLEKGDGYLIQMRYLESNVEHPGTGPEIQSTRKHYISPYMTESEIVETIWLMVQRSALHVASEHFQYKGRRVYSQHFSVDARISWCENEMFDVREPTTSSENLLPK